MYIYVYVLPGTNARDVILYVGKPKLQREAGQVYTDCCNESERVTYNNRRIQLREQQSNNDGYGLKLGIVE